MCSINWHSFLPSLNYIQSSCGEGKSRPKKGEELYPFRKRHVQELVTPYLNIRYKLKIQQSAFSGNAQLKEYIPTWYCGSKRFTWFQKMNTQTEWGKIFLELLKKKKKKAEAVPVDLQHSRWLLLQLQREYKKDTQWRCGCPNAPIL